MALQKSDLRVYATLVEFSHPINTVFDLSCEYDREEFIDLVSPNSYKAFQDKLPECFI